MLVDTLFYYCQQIELRTSIRKVISFPQSIEIPHGLLKRLLNELFFGGWDRRYFVELDFGIDCVVNKIFFR
jgi:hypothetical protein